LAFASHQGTTEKFRNHGGTTAVLSPSLGSPPRCTSKLPLGGFARGELRPDAIAATLPSEQVHHRHSYHVVVDTATEGTARCSTRSPGHEGKVVPYMRIRGVGGRWQRVDHVPTWRRRWQCVRSATCLGSATSRWRRHRLTTHGGLDLDAITMRRKNSSWKTTTPSRLDQERRNRRAYAHEGGGAWRKMKK
uniref:Uncharacterized protein n=1 Tax=Triticum urartu TaxID=4572 RepID=A0A8R7PNP8_TRIUA